ncbi:helix-turn-helix domain-containing protein [Streptococcus sobrinus]|uniref:helix-turn-helix domain-containing protein n=1 Tax=Streptococcus sobrinus TaxID=1310 RepID=UPI0020D22874|nr:helix-turn-helix transcriptional regulator [Streptococcus sobrinus]
MENKTLVANLRKQKGWTQERLAEKAGLSVRTIQRIERGDDSSLETLGPVANALSLLRSSFKLTSLVQRWKKLLPILMSRPANWKSGKLKINYFLSID